MISRSVDIQFFEKWWNVHFEPFDKQEVDAWLQQQHGGLISQHWKHRSYRIAQYAHFAAFRDEESAILCHLAFAR